MLIFSKHTLLDCFIILNKAENYQINISILQNAKMTIKSDNLYIIKWKIEVSVLYSCAIVMLLLEQISVVEIKVVCR